MIISTPEIMFDLGREIAGKHSLILLRGELGAGKTTFSKGFAKGLDIDPDLVHSPTFTYMNIYDEKMLHIDMYRLENPQDLLHKGILDAIDEYEYVVIERPKRTEQYADGSRKEILIEKKDNARDIVLNNYDAGGEVNCSKR